MIITRLTEYLVQSAVKEKLSFSGLSKQCIEAASDVLVLQLLSIATSQSAELLEAHLELGYDEQGPQSLDDLQTILWRERKVRALGYDDSVEVAE